MKKIVRKTEKLQNKIERRLDKELVPIYNSYVGKMDEISDLYRESLLIPSDKTLHKKELYTLIQKLDKPNTYLFHYLLGRLALAKYNARTIHFLLGIYNISVNQSVNLLTQFDTLFTETVQMVFMEDLLKKKTPLNNDLIREILSYRINNVHYSQRIWQNTARLDDKILDTLVDGLVKGKSVQEMVLSLQEATDVGLSACNRLIKTELNAVYNNALVSYYKMCGITHLQQISTLDNRTSVICRERHLKIIKIKDAVVGDTIPPLHPYCRSIIIPFYI